MRERIIMLHSRETISLVARGSGRGVALCLYRYAHANGAECHCQG